MRIETHVGVRVWVVLPDMLQRSFFLLDIWEPRISKFASKCRKDVDWLTGPGRMRRIGRALGVSW